MAKRVGARDFSDGDAVLVTDEGAAVPMTTVNYSPSAEPEPEDDPMQDIAHDPASRIMAELGQVTGDAEAFVNVWRMPEMAGKKEAFVWRYSPSEFSLEALRTKFGGGTYKVVGYKRAAESPRNMRVFVNTTIEIERLPEPPQISTGASDMALLVSAMQKGFEQMGAMILQAAPKGQTRSEMLAEFEAISRIFAPTRNAQVQADPLDLLGRILPIVKSLTPEQPITEDQLGPNSILFKGIEMITEAFRKSRETIPANSQVAATAVNSAPAAATLAAPVAEGDEVGIFLRAQLTALLLAAEKQSEPSLYSELIYDQAPDEIIVKLQAPDWFAQLVALDARCAPHQAWLKNVRDGVIRILKSQDTPSTEANRTLTTAPGNATTPGNGNSSKGK